jgi:hypothetical protein
MNYLKQLIMDNNFLKDVVGNDKSLIRFLILIAVTLIVALATTWLLFRYLKKQNSDVEVSFSSEGATLIVSEKSKKAIFLLPASVPWVNTGIIVNENTPIKFTTSGRVHLAINNLVKAAEANIKPRIEWTGPEGYDAGLAEKDRYRTSILISPKSKLGKIIGYVKSPNDIIPGPKNRSPANIFEVESNIVFTPSKTGELWLCVNDFLLSPNDSDSHKAYVGDTQGRERSERIQEFNKIVSQGYWEIWFDDNIGEYMLQIDLNSK